MKGDLHRALQKALGNVPRVFLERIIEKKLVEAGVEPTRKLVRKLTETVMIGETSEIIWNGGDADRDMVISFSDEDATELDEAMQKCLQGDLQEIIMSLSLRTARGIVRRLKQSWPEQHAWQQQVQSEFQDRLLHRWGEGLNLLAMLLTISRELGEEAFHKRRRSRAKRNLHRSDVLIRLHARACQVTAEIITLMESGYADGAMARWRTLHEICTIATLIAKNDNELSERYMAHDVVESKRALEVFLHTYKDLGYKPPAKREVRRTEKLYESVVGIYGLEFGSQYGWAGKHLGLRRPQFTDLENAAQRSRMRSHYKLACQSVHAGTKGITHQLGVLPSASVILAGPSNAEFEEPGQNTAISLTQITSTLFGPHWKFDDIVILRVLVDLQNQAVKAFVRAGRQLAREEAARTQVHGQRKAPPKRG